MILVDANLLVYAQVSDFEQHEPSRAWLEDKLAGTARVGMAWESLLAFVRLVTNPRVFPSPSTLPEAWAQVETWLAVDVVWTPLPTSRHREHVAELIVTAGLRANDVPDVHLAALARQHGLRLATTDTGFARFADLEWFDPLAG